MSPDLERLIGRAVVEKQFRDALLADADAAIQNAGFKLTSQETVQIKDNVSRINADPKEQTQIDQQFDSGAASFW